MSIDAPPTGSAPAVGVVPTGEAAVGPTGGLAVWVVGLAGMAGLVLRLVALTGRLGALDSDEAVVGLMAGDILDGRPTAFFWGQHYAGTAETALVAAVFAVAGTGVVALKSVSLGLSAVAAVLVWRVGRRAVDERSAQVGALLLWVAPAAYLWLATKARGYYWVALIVGLLLVLAAQRIAQDGSRGRDWALLGAAAGLGWWTSPTIAYFAVPAGAWLLLRRPSLRRAWLAVPPALVCAAPWLWHNAETRLSSLHQPPQPEQAGYLTGMGRLVWQGIPLALDLRRPVTVSWYLGGAVAYLAVVAGIGWAVARRRDRPVLVLLGVAAYPWIYAAFPGRWYVGDGRYALFLAPFLFLLLAWAVRTRLAQCLLLVVATVLSVVGLQAIPHDPTRDYGEDIAVLRDAGIDHLWSDYWVSYRLMFESDLEIVSSSGLYQRSESILDEVAASERPAWAYFKGDGRVAGLREALAGLGVRTELVPTTHFDVVVADRRVDPEAVPPALRI